MPKLIKNTILTILFLTLAGAVTFLAYLHFFAADERDLSGTWSTQLDMTGQASAAALGWLQDIEAVSITPEDMASYMQGLTIQVNLTMEQTARYEGTFYCNVLPESYEVCKRSAYEGFAAAFKDLLAERLHMAGYTGTVDAETLETLVNETFGMSTIDYLRSAVPNLLPSLEELQAQYDGSGIYGVEETKEACILTRQFEAGGIITIRRENYIRRGGTLILTGEAAFAGFADSAGTADSVGTVESAGDVTGDGLPDNYPLLYTLLAEEGESQ
ncbi:MAG: hypothetical protein NC434_01950 [Ruminococcus sp.]|nr:hypothetical protein [Ruminococcus sp.]